MKRPILLAIVIAVIVGCAGSGTPQPPTWTPEAPKKINSTIELPTATNEPTSTQAKPTATRIIPTRTLKPTVVILPTNTPTNTPTPAPTACCSIWSTSVVPARAAVTDGRPLEIGVKFRSDVAGYITGLRFYKGTANTGTHIGNLWSNTGTLLATATFTNETASGWQEVTFSSPVAVVSNTTYIASYFSKSGYFAVNIGYFVRGVHKAPLHALASGVVGPNGVYQYDTSGFPRNGTNNNYWVDVVFTTSTTPVPTPTNTPTATPTAAPSNTGLLGPSANAAVTTSDRITSMTTFGRTSATLFSHRRAA